jgi:hypothetical protein
VLLIQRRVVAALAILLCSSCRSAPQSRAVEQGRRFEPADSLVLTAEDGAEVWFTLARADRTPAGQSCWERGIEIRRAGGRTPVPLLYTGDPPALVNDSTLRATLWTHCKAGDSYLVDLRTGRPVREHGRAP